jgi:hypothetical protein
VGIWSGAVPNCAKLWRCLLAKLSAQTTTSGRQRMISKVEDKKETISKKISLTACAYLAIVHYF